MLGSPELRVPEGVFPGQAASSAAMLALAVHWSCRKGCGDGPWRFLQGILATWVAPTAPFSAWHAGDWARDGDNMDVGVDRAVTLRTHEGRSNSVLA